MLAPITMEKVLDLVEPRGEDPASDRARHGAVFAVRLAGGRMRRDREPVAEIVRGYVAEAGAARRASSALRPVPPRAAALANGAISHALDYDDTHFG